MSVFVSGCTHNCFNCFNKDYQDFKYGDRWTKSTTQKLIALLQCKQIKGLALLGGEPFQQCLDLTGVVKEIKETVDKDIWVWSGYTFEQIIADQNKLELLKLCDVLVDGRFIESQKDLTLRFRGSRNQRIINIKESLENNKIVLHELN